mmetsp:Transcript_24609/g.40815  ORF Transcript_24609/g.40815 Transcript_24609/m.40815 type:complete len:709 (+) Transcript_24609:44-2170(+)
MVTFGLFAVAATVPTFQPTAIQFSTLSDGLAKDELEQALTDVGMISVTDIPNYSTLKLQVLTQSHECSKKSQAAAEHTYSDGTTRRTLATYTIPGPGGAQAIDHKTSDKACADFDDSAARFRAVVADVTNVFSERLSALLDLESPLLTTQRGFELTSFHDVVENGEHLEHFHSYTRPPQVASGTTPTIEMHTDQGIFIAFTPALMLLDGATDSKVDAGRFYIERPDGSRALVRFHDDSLVFMLGDGVHQVLSPKKLHESSPRLRTTPHALVAPMTEPSGARVWYGRMVLAPNDAVHEAHGKTFGHLRELMVKATLEQDESAEVISLGCSGEGVRAQQRELSSCAEGTVYCWNRCMNTTSDRGVYFGISPAICEAQGAALQCTDVLDRIYDPTYDRHGDYFPACSTSTKFVDSDLPTFPDFPPNSSVCTATAWDVFADTAGYDFAFALGKNGKLMWSVEDDKIKSKMVYNGLFGYLSWGFRNPTGGLNGMKGSWVAMALPGGDYSLKGGLNLSQPGSVKPYRIHDEQSRFRFWEGSGHAASGFGGAIPLVNNTLHATEYEKNDCFSSMSFTAATIGPRPFTISGTDTLIWSANVENKYVEYHGRSHRGIIDITWKVGGSEFTDYPPPPPPSPAPPSPTPPPAAPPSKSKSDGLLEGAIIGIVIGAVAGVALISLGVYFLLKRTRKAPPVKDPISIEKKGEATVTETGTA